MRIKTSFSLWLFTRLDKVGLQTTTVPFIKKIFVLLPHKQGKKFKEEEMPLKKVWWILRVKVFLGVETILITSTPQ